MWRKSLVSFPSAAAEHLAQQPEAALPVRRISPDVDEKVYEVDVDVY
jgi:hypothetical protein